jgi:hypothetical protein
MEKKQISNEEVNQMKKKLLDICSKSHKLNIEVMSNHCDINMLKLLLTEIHQDIGSLLITMPQDSKKEKSITSALITKGKRNSYEILSSVKSNDDEINKELQIKISELNNKKSYQNTNLISDLIVIENLSETKEIVSRELPGGGMAPPQIKTVSDIDMEFFVKNRLIEEMRRMQKSGEHINPEATLKKKPLSLESLSETFKYLEDVDNYSGSFLINVIKNENEISSFESSMQLDLGAEKLLCKKGDYVLISVYDICSSYSENEAKKFLILFKFDELYGILKSEKIIIENEYSFSLRQVEELKKFCKAKKIKYEAIC